MYIYACNKIDIKRAHEFKIEHRGVCRRVWCVEREEKYFNFSVFFFKNLRFVNWQKKGKKRKMSTSKPYSLIILRFKK